MAEQKYKRLTRERGSARFSVVSVTRSSLWLGEDHLLLAETTGYSETYKRFFFRDIQAFTIRKTKTRLVWNWVWGALLAISGLIIWAATHDNASPWPALVCGGIALVIFGIPLLLNTLFGPTCACQIRTAVQTEDLPSLSRVRKTQKVMNRIRPEIIGAQGQLTGEEVSARLREGALTPAASPDPTGDLPPVIS
jgi:hypothetical protein